MVRFIVLNPLGLGSSAQGTPSGGKTCGVPRKDRWKGADSDALRRSYGFPAVGVFSSLSSSSAAAAGFFTCFAFATAEFPCADPFSPSFLPPARCADGQALAVPA